MPTGRGVDVHPFYQRGAQLDGVEYLWLKMTDGARVYTKSYQGVVYRADVLAAQARQRGIPLGGYVYAQPGDGGTEASVLWGECQRLGGTSVAPGCDIESDKNIHVWSKAEATDHGRAFCSWFRGRGIRPAIYMGAAFAQQVRPDLWPENPVIWIARYGAKPEAPGPGQYLGRYDVHQYTSSGTLPGSAGAVDWNQAYTNAHLLGAAPNGEEPDMDAKQERALFEVLEQLVGTRNLDQYPGWDKQAPKDFAKATLVDFVRQTHAELKALQTTVAQTNAPTIDYAKLAAALPLEMAEDIAERVATKLADRLAQ